MLAGDRQLQAHAQGVAATVARSLVANGARAVVLTGSFARGEGRAESDIDLIVLGDGPEYELRRVVPFLVSVSFRTSVAVRAEFLQLPVACTSVPGWRVATLLQDPSREAAALQSEALAWTWSNVRESARQWVAAEVTGYAEEVHKLASRSHEPNAEAAAIAAIIAVRLPRLACVFHEQLYGSDSALWDTAAAVMGEEWAGAQSIALGLVPSTLSERAEAALLLYRLMANAATGLFDDRQREVVTHAAALAKAP